MRITDLRAVQPPTPRAPQDWRTQLGQIVVRVETDEGLVGYGVGGGGAAGIHVIHTVLRDLLVGQDATPVEDLHRRMCRHTAFYGRKGLVVMAISGVDLALWDLRGKAAGQPVARLLNHQVDLARPLPTYTTAFNEKETEAALTAGHAAVKISAPRFGDPPDVRPLAELFARLRAALGQQALLMVDGFGRWDFETAMTVAEALAPFDLTWLEEPLPPDDLKGYARLAKVCPITLAGGEHEYLADGFAELIDRRLHAVLQPDINWCGGLTTLIDVYRLAQSAGLRVCPHRGSEPYSLHAIAALDEQPLAESGRSWFDCLQGAAQIQSGHIQVPDRPGFGVRPDPGMWVSR